MRTAVFLTTGEPGTGKGSRELACARRMLHQDILDHAHQFIGVIGDRVAVLGLRALHLADVVDDRWRGDCGPR